MVLLNVRVKSSSGVPRAFAALDILKELGVDASIHSVTKQFALDTHLLYCVWLTFETDEFGSSAIDALRRAGVVLHESTLDELESGVVDKWRLTIEQFLYDTHARSERRAARELYKMFSAKWDSLAWFRERVAAHKTLCKRVGVTANRHETEPVPPSKVGQKRKGYFD